MEEIYCFAGNPLDRVSERRRDAGWISSLLDEPSTKLIPLRDLKPAIRNGTQMECVHCTACIDACDSVMDKIGRPRGLIDLSQRVLEGAPILLKTQTPA